MRAIIKYCGYLGALAFTFEICFSLDFRVEYEVQLPFCSLQAHVFASHQSLHDTAYGFMQEFLNAHQMQILLNYLVQLVKLVCKLMFSKPLIRSFS